MAKNLKTKESLNGLAALRVKAQTALQRPVHGQGAPAGAVQALRVLSDMAATPRTAPDALALLHELQVHQVEVDLQAEELRDITAQLEAELAHLRLRHDGSPAGHLLLDPQGRVLAVNRQGAWLLGTEARALIGDTLDPHLAPPSAAALHALMAQAGQGPEASCLLTPRAIPGKPGAPGPLCAVLGPDPAGQGWLLALLALPPG